LGGAVGTMSPATLTWLVETSGMAQLAFAVLLGWPIFLHRRYPLLQKIIPSRSRLLQSHIDDVFMGLLQVVLAGYIAKGGMVLALLFVFGSWMNAQIFLFLALSNDRCANQLWFKIVTLTSFLSLTFAYVALLAAQFA
jgi:hypothetical protein